MAKFRKPGHALMSLNQRYSSTSHLALADFDLRAKLEHKLVQVVT